jgi:hypothetical protein
MSPAPLYLVPRTCATKNLKIHESDTMNFRFFVSDRKFRADDHVGGAIMYEMKANLTNFISKQAAFSLRSGGKSEIVGCKIRKGANI